MIICDSVERLAEFDVSSVALAIGNFDGVHLGHQEIIRQLIDAAEKSGSLPAVLTFKPHPRKVLKGIDVPELMSFSLTKILLKELGVKAIVAVPFTKEFAEKSPDEFVEFLENSKKVKVTDICVGSQWHFGKDKKGDISFLKSLNRFNVHPVNEVFLGGKLVSSTLIREYLHEGDFEEAEKFLTRPYALRGVVEKGWGIATQVLDCPTANIHFEENYLPVQGVFGVKCRYYNDQDVPSQWYYGVCNVGTAPTFNEDGQGVRFKVEVHFFNVSRDLYELLVEVEFKFRIRDEFSFDSPEALKEQISKDNEFARSRFGIS